MAKKRNWFSLIKGIFVSDAKSKLEKKKKRWWRWVFGRHKLKRLPTLEAPLPIREKTLSEAEEEQSKHALTVAIATAAAADAAVAAAQAAAEVVRLTGNPQPNHQCGKGDKDLAAIKIQTAFRGYLARKALRALKGLVKLQAIIRGRAVRRQTIAALKCLQSIVNIQSQVCERKLKTSEPNWNYVENKQLNGPRKKLVFKEKLLESNGPQKQDDSILSREARNSMSLSRRETMIKREHIKEYSYGNQERRERRVVRRPTELEPKKVNGRWSYWLEQWADAQTCKVEEPQIFDSVVCSNPLHKDVEQGTHVRLRTFQKWDHFGGSSSPNSAPRRSFHHLKQNSIGEDNSFSILTTIPTYMAATESAKAKARSISTPRQRQGVLDSYSDHNSPSKNRHYLLSSIDSEGTSTGTIGKPIASQQRSPSLKGMPVPIKSQQISKDLSIDSQFSWLNWDQHSAFR